MKSPSFATDWRLSTYWALLCPRGIALVVLMAWVLGGAALAQQSTVVNYGDTWKYSLPASDPGTSWRTIAFNDTAWASGPGLLGYETGTVPSPGIRTTVGNNTISQPVYLFRKSFTFTGDPAGASFVIDQIIDDSVTWYLNGNILGSVRHSPGVWNNLSTGNIGDAAIELNAVSGAATGLVYGNNVLSAEVHQAAAMNSDMVFGAKLTLNSTPLTSSNWRLINFGTINNTGNAADLADGDKDGLVNLAEYALLQDPVKPSVWGTIAVQGSNLTLTYLRRKAALNEATFTTLWAPAPDGPWSATGVTEQILSDDGLVQSVQAQVALNGAAKKFFHVNVTRMSVTLPTAPSVLAATVVSTSQINLSWTDNANNETGFKIERKTGSGGTYAQIATVGAGVTTYSSTGLTAATNYYYRVRANNSAGDSAYSNEANATTFSNVALPVAPSSLTATATSSVQINLAWTDNSNVETGFKIERKTGSGGTYAEITTVGANVTSYQSTGLTGSTQYYYRIRATNSAGDSAYSNEANANTQASTTFQNPGVYSQVVNNLLYEWIPSKDVSFQIQPDGKVKVIAPLTKRSFNNANDCKRFIYDHTHKRLSTADANALFGSGLALPVGNHGFCILWVNANTYDEVLNGGWTLTANPDTYQSNSQKVDYFNLSIVPVSPTTPPASNVQEVIIPYDLQRVSWLPHYQVLPYSLNLPADRGFGITRMLMDVPLAQVYQKVTQIQYMYGFLDTVPNSRKWMCLRAYGESNAQLIQNAPLDKNFGYLSQMDEDFGNMGDPNHLQRAQQVYQGIYQRFQNEQGVTSPNQTRLYDDYFSDFGGYSNSENFRFGFNANRMVAGLSNQTMARKAEGGASDCAYFTQGAYNYRNWRVGGYLDSFERIPEGIRIYNEIYNYEKRFMAAPDRKVVKMGWTNSEGVNSLMYVHGTETRLHFAGGDIIRSVEIAWPFHMMLNESFWAVLLGHDYDLWHSSVPLVSNINNFGDSWAAGAGPTQWQPTGGSTVNYDSNNASHPARSSSSLGQFPTNPHLGESGAFTGAWLVSQLTTASDRISTSIEYCPFSYKLNGGAVLSGYYNSNNPTNGSLGNAKLSRFGVANFGQSNIVKTFEAKKPICIYTSGANGAAVIYHNVYCGLADVNEVTITTPIGTRTFQVTGNSLHVFYLN